MKVFKTAQFGTVFGSFGKGIAGSRTINFGVSGGEFCDPGCTLKGNGCYAETTEKLKTSITKNLVKKQADPEGYAKVLADNVWRIANAPFVRFNSFGSIPATGSQVWVDSMKQLARYLDPAIVHFPVETAWKAAIVTMMGFVPRLSLGLKPEMVQETVAKGTKVSVVIDCGKRVRGKNKRTTAQPAFEYAKGLNAQGITAKVCPAITGSAKCGACKLCTGSGPMVVVYPLH